MRIILAIAATAALTGSAFAADLGPIPAKPRAHTTQRYAPVPDEQDYATPQYSQQYSVVPQTVPTPTCPNQFAGIGAPTCASAAYGSPCGAGYGYGGYPGPVLAGGYGLPIPFLGGGFGFRGFHHRFR